MTANPANSDALAPGLGDTGGEVLPAALRQFPTPITYCRVLYRDGKACDLLYLFANRAAELTYGTAPISGRLASEIVPGFPESRRRILEIYDRIARGGGPAGFDLYVGNYRKWITVQAFSPKPGHFVAIFTTVDDKLSGRQLRNVCDAMAEGFVVRGRDGRIIDFNPATERILGYTAERLRGLIPDDRDWRTLREDLAPLPREQVPARITLRTGEPLRDRVIGLKFPDGRLKWISVNTEPIGGEGAPDYVVSTLSDITARRETERQRLATLETMGDGFFALDAQWRFVYVNPAAESMLGARREALIGSNHWDLYPHTLGTPLEKAYRQAAAGRPSELEHCSEPRDRWFSCRCFPRESGGIRVFLTDVTEAREARNALHRSHAELRSLVGQMNAAEERERSRIARELHDDLQQSLAAVRLEIKAIRRRAGSLGPDVEELADAAARNVDLVIESTRRIVSDLRPAVLDALGLSAGIDAAAGRFRALTGMNVDVRTLGPPSAAMRLPEEIGYCLYRIAQEALNNVHKHARARGVELRLDLRDPEQVQLLVRDDGCGLAPGALRKEGSFGVLGMRERLHALGGELAIEDVPGGGTIVIARVPIRSG